MILLIENNSKQRLTGGGALSVGGLTSGRSSLDIAVAVTIQSRGNLGKESSLLRMFMGAQIPQIPCCCCWHYCTHHSFAVRLFSSVQKECLKPGTSSQSLRVKKREENRTIPNKREVICQQRKWCRDDQRRKEKKNSSRFKKVNFSCPVPNFWSQIIRDSIPPVCFRQVELPDGTDCDDVPRFTSFRYCFLIYFLFLRKIKKCCCFSFRFLSSLQARCSCSCFCFSPLFISP